MGHSQPGTSVYRKSIGFPRQEYWSGLPFPAPGDLLDLEIEPVSTSGLCIAGRFSTNESPAKPSKHLIKHQRKSQLNWYVTERSGERNGNPLQCSCLENPRDRGAWWAAVYGVAQSRTWLKRLSSSSSSNRREI